MELTEETHAFVVESFDSVESIEILLLLRRSPNTFWTAKAASDVLAMPAELAAKKLTALDAAGLLRRGETSGAYRYAPQSEELAERVDHLAEAYANQRVNVIHLIYSTSTEQLRAFSNAFRLKNE